MNQKKFKVGLIRVLTSNDQNFVNMHGEEIMKHYPNIEVVSRCIPDQWEGIHSHELCEIAVPKIVKVAQEFDNPDMIIVSCADDPGVAAIKEAMPGMPVTGGGESTVALALRYSDKIGVLGIVDYAPLAYETLVKDKLVAVERPEGVNSTLDLLTPEGRESCIACAKKIKSMGAGVIALACTGLNTIGIAKELEEAAGIPVIDPVLAEGAVAYFESIRHQ